MGALFDWIIEPIKNYVSIKWCQSSIKDMKKLSRLRLTLLESGENMVVLFLTLLSFNVLVSLASESSVSTQANCCQRIAKVSTGP